ncbi:MAG: ABC transporter ATP-binding protein [Calditrichia bacterium]
MIQVEDLQKSFGDHRVIDHANLVVKDNETLVIIGPSGEGKTVFIKLLNRLLEPDAGRILYDGKDITRMKKGEFYRFRKRIAFVFQQAALFDFLTIRDNLLLFLTMHENIPVARQEKMAREALSYVGLERSVLDKYPSEISGGMKKRVAIARAFIQRPQYIFYDEPTTGLDEINAQKVSELIETLKHDIHATSIIVTHDINLMNSVADRVAFFYKGKIKQIVKPEEIKEEMLTFLYKGVA